MISILELFSQSDSSKTRPDVDPILDQLHMREEGIRRIVAESNIYQLSSSIFNRKESFPTIQPLTGHGKFNDYVEDRFSLSVSLCKKYLRIGLALHEYEYHLNGLDLNQVRSPYHLTYLGMALSHHSTADVKEALVRLPYRQFVEIAKAHERNHKPRRKAESQSVPVVPSDEVLADQGQLHDAFNRDLGILMMGCRSKDQVEQGLKVLQDHVRSRSFSIGASENGPPKPANVRNQELAAG